VNVGLSLLDFAIQLIPVALFVTVIWLSVSPTFLRRLISRFREKAIYESERSTSKYRPAPRFALFHVLVSWSVLFVIGISIGIHFGLQLFGSREEVRNTQFAILIPLLVASFIIHLRPNHSRELKYSLILTGLGGVGFLQTGSLAGLGFSGIDTPIKLEIPLAVVILGFWFIPVFIAVTWSLPYWIRAMNSRYLFRGKVARYSLAFFRLHQFGPLVLVCLFFQPDVAMILLAGRWWIPTRSATPSTALVPQRKGGFPIPNAGLLLGFPGDKDGSARRNIEPLQ
jgi:hypothetical protein